jgi:hypothetical protein
MQRSAVTTDHVEPLYERGDQREACGVESVRELRKAFWSVAACPVDCNFSRPGRLDFSLRFRWLGQRTQTDGNRRR